jgi:hypothetical protein
VSAGRVLGVHVSCFCHFHLDVSLISLGGRVHIEKFKFGGIPWVVYEKILVPVILNVVNIVYQRY